MLQEEVLLQVKDAEIAKFWQQLSILEVSLARSINAASTPVATSTRNLTNVSDDCDMSIFQIPPGQRNKAPPIKSFTGEELIVCSLGQLVAYPKEGSYLE